MMQIFRIEPADRPERFPGLGQGCQRPRLASRRAGQRADLLAVRVQIELLTVRNAGARERLSPDVDYGKEILRLTKNANQLLVGSL